MAPTLVNAATAERAVRRGRARLNACRMASLACSVHGAWRVRCGGRLQGRPTTQQATDGAVATNGAPCRKPLVAEVVLCCNMLYCVATCCTVLQHCCCNERRTVQEAVAEVVPQRKARHALAEEDLRAGGREVRTETAVVRGGYSAAWGTLAYSTGCRCFLPNGTRAGTALPQAGAAANAIACARRC